MRSLSVPETCGCRRTLRHIRCSHRISKFQNDCSTVSVRVLQLSHAPPQCFTLLHFFPLPAYHPVLSFRTLLPFLSNFHILHMLPTVQKCLNSVTTDRRLVFIHLHRQIRLVSHNLPEHMEIMVSVRSRIGQDTRHTDSDGFYIFALVRMYFERLNGQYTVWVLPWPDHRLCPCR